MVAGRADPDLPGAQSKIKLRGSYLTHEPCKPLAIAKDETR